MSSIAVKGADTGTGVFTIESPATNTDRTITLPDEAGEIITNTTLGGEFSAFKAFRSATVAISSSTWTTVVFNTESFDTNSFYDASTGIFTPTVAGYYQLNCSVSLQGFPASRWLVAFYNGTTRLYKGDLNGVSSSDFMCQSGSGVFYFNGTTDSMRVQVFCTGTSPDVGGDSNGILSDFSGHLVRKA